MADEPSTDRSRLLKTSITALAVSALASALLWSGALRHADNWVYDALLAHSGERADDNIVIVAIDDKSLAALGRWPWRRKIHADLLDRLAKARPRGIALDVAFAEPDDARPEDDRALARAIARAGRVVLPVMVERSEPTGPLVEVLPIASLAEAAAGLGHAVVDTDIDGTARSTYLQAGLGDPHWPALALALHRLDPAARAQTIPGLRKPAATASPYLWVRDYRVLLPYVPEQDFQEVSYIDVLRGQVPDALLRNRWLLIGTTAAGASDNIQTPLSSGDDRISGVIYHADVFNMLLHRSAILPLSPPWQWGLSILACVLPAVLLTQRWARRAHWYVVPAAAFLVALSSALLLHYGHRWFAPMAAMTTLFAALLAFALYRLRRTLRMARVDALTGLSNRRAFDLVHAHALQSARGSGLPVSLLLVGIDRFRKFKDLHGRLAGEQVLCAIVRVISSRASRTRDFPARFGDGEIAILLPDTPTGTAAEIADSIVAEVQALRIPYTHADIAPFVSVSIGVASMQHSSSAADDSLLARAAAALYEAKQLGRNRSHQAPAREA